MATFKICVFPHQKRRDEKYPVSIRVYWEKKSAYIKTEYYVVIEQINQNKRKKIFELKDTAIIGELTDRIKLFEKAKVDILGMSIYTYSASELARYFESLMSNSEKKEEIDFIEFARKHIASETAKGRNVKRIQTSINALVDYSGESISIHDVTSKYLNSFVKHLQTERLIVRGNERSYMNKTSKPVSPRSIKGYISDIRNVFNEAVSFYNDEDKGDLVIGHTISMYRIELPVITQAKKRNISDKSIYKLHSISNLLLKKKKVIFARDTFIMSFMFLGMNYKDMYELKKNDVSEGRISYKRAKTRSRREDEALISFRIEPEAIKYIEKYKDRTNSEYFFDFYTRYIDSHIFVSRIASYLKRVAVIADVDNSLSTYYARHSWATIARNKCNISKSDIDECLNHKNKDEEMADIYIEKDWSLIDDTNRKVLDHVFISCNPRKVFVKSNAFLT